MKSLYALILEKLSRDIAMSTAVGMTAGMRAAVGQAQDGETMESRVERELDAVFADVVNPPAIVAASSAVIGNGSGNNTALPKRGPGRPRKNPVSEGQS